MNYWFFLCGILLPGFLFATPNPTDIENALSKICALSSDEIAIMEECAYEFDGCDARDHVVLRNLDRKLSHCARLLAEATHNNFSNEQPSATENSRWISMCTLQNLKTGCDWFIRAAGFIWALQTFYGLVF